MVRLIAFMLTPVPANSHRHSADLIHRKIFSECNLWNNIGAVRAFILIPGMCSYVVCLEKGTANVFIQKLNWGRV